MKTRRIPVICFVLIIMISYENIVSGQEQKAINKEMEKIAMPGSKAGWIKFKKEITINPNSVFRDYKTAFELGSDDQMVSTNIKKDKGTEYTHYYFNQYYKGIKIMGAQFSLHQNNEGRIISANGKIASGLDMSVIPVINEKEALNILLMNYADAKTVAWLDQEMEYELKSESGNPLATYFPKGELVIRHKDQMKGFVKDNLFLVWKFDIYSKHGSDSKTFFLDANTGQVIGTLPLSINCSAGSVTTVFSGVQTIYTSLAGITGEYELVDNCSTHPGYTIHTKDAAFHDNTFNASYNLTDADNDWDDNSRITSVARTHWCAEKADEFYRVLFSRNSFNDSNSNIRVVANYNFGAPSYGKQSSWYKTPFTHSIRIGFGADDNSNLDDYSTLDVVGHELTHGVIEYGVSGGLDYEKQSGAINESIADCMGEAIEHYVKGSNDWMSFGEVDTLRNFRSPKSCQQPSTYLSPDIGGHWFEISGCSPAHGNDYCGIHTNSGVGNKWFYLLSEGGSGTNDYLESYSLTGIGIADAVDIIYYSMPYLFPTANYPDYREATILAAEDLFGSCSNQVIEVARAWNAVGVGSTLDAWSTELCNNIPISIGPITIYDYKAINSIVSPGSGCNYAKVDLSTGSVVFTSGNFITLKEGFHALQNTSNSFTAVIDECALSYHYRKGTENSIDDLDDLNKTSNLSGIRIFPNPFSATAEIEFNSKKSELVTLRLYDSMGRILKTLYDGLTEENRKYNIVLDAAELNSGFYFCRLSGSGFSKTLKVQLIK